MDVKFFFASLSGSAEVKQIGSSCSENSINTQNIRLAFLFRL